MKLMTRGIPPSLSRAVRWLAVGLALTLMGLALYPTLATNLERVRLLKQLDLAQPARGMDELAWDAGWRSLCGDDIPAAGRGQEAGNEALPFVAMANIDRGDYATALVQFERLAVQDAVGVPNAPAYVAAFSMDWVNAARAYRPEPTARHQRFWGTIFYLAAQQLMFMGRLEEATSFFRQADVAYGVRGPYRGLSLVDCLEERGRPAEAFDAYRRALVTLPAAEALDHLSRFNRLRLEGLRAWRELEPANEQVARWLANYEADVAERMPAEALLPSRPAPKIPLDLDIGGGQSLIGFDYRAEDIQTGPFMEIDFYLRWRAMGVERYARERRTVLNRAPNGAFLWDRVPAGVRPFGWLSIRLRLSSVSNGCAWTPGASEHPLAYKATRCPWKLRLESTFREEQRFSMAGRAFRSGGRGLECRTRTPIVTWTGGANRDSRPW
jgi:tetratricopeptide (TPR) repeat protein